MKKHSILFTALCTIAFIIFSCGNKTSDTIGSTQMDLSVLGFWEGAMEPIPFIGFKGVRIFNTISRNDSTFVLITTDTSRHASIPIKDTTLYLGGKWRLTLAKDSILLMPDTCRIIDTALNILVPRNVRGQTIPMFITIANHDVTNDIEWTVAVQDMIPLGPLLGMNLKGVPVGLLQAVQVILVKRWQ